MLAVEKTVSVWRFCEPLRVITLPAVVYCAVTAPNQ